MIFCPCLPALVCPNVSHTKRHECVIDVLALETEPMDPRL